MTSTRSRAAARLGATLLVAISLAGAAGEAVAQAGSGLRNGTSSSFGAARAQAGSSRESALRECTALERRTSPPVRDSNASLYAFRACMNEHGQPE